MSKGRQSPNKRTLGWDLGLLRMPEMKAHTGLPGGLQAWGALRRHISGAHSVWNAEPPAQGLPSGRRTRAAAGGLPSASCSSSTSQAQSLLSSHSISPRAGHGTRPETHEHRGNTSSVQRGEDVWFPLHTDLTAFNQTGTGERVTFPGFFLFYCEDQ